LNVVAEKGTSITPIIPSESGQRRGNRAFEKKGLSNFESPERRAASFGRIRMGGEPSGSRSKAQGFAHGKLRGPSSEAEPPQNIMKSGAALLLGAITIFSNLDATDIDRS